MIYIGTTIQKTIKLTNEIKDPKDNNYYTYSTNGSKTKYQLLAILENNPALAYDQNTKLINQANAQIDYTTRYPYTTGNKVGIFFTGTTNQPLQETNSGTLALSGITTQMKVMFSNASVTSSGTIIATGSSLPAIVVEETQSVATTQQELPQNLITQTICTNANWFWVDDTTDTIGTGYCISPRVGDFPGDTTGNGISFNGWGNYANENYNGWDSSSIDDTGNSFPQYGQTRKLDTSAGYTCKSLGTATSDYDTRDNLQGRMKWLTTNKANLTQLQDIDWITNAIPPNGHPVPALYISDCIDGTKDIGTDMPGVTYARYTTDVTVSTDTRALLNATYQNRQKYLLEWTKKSGSHLPSAYSTLGGSDAGTGNGEYYLACNSSKLTDANDQTDAEWIWLSSIGNTGGFYWGSAIRLVGPSGCSSQNDSYVGHRGGNVSARFVVR